jgi:hypothetical protein
VRCVEITHFTLTIKRMWYLKLNKTDAPLENEIVSKSLLRHYIVFNGCSCNVLVYIVFNGCPCNNVIPTCLPHVIRLFIPTLDPCPFIVKRTFTCAVSLYLRDRNQTPPPMCFV